MKIALVKTNQPWILSHSRSVPNIIAGSERMKVKKMKPALTIAARKAKQTYKMSVMKKKKIIHNAKYDNAEIRFNRREGTTNG